MCAVHYRITGSGGSVPGNLEKTVVSVFPHYNAAAADDDDLHWYAG